MPQFARFQLHTHVTYYLLHMFCWPSPDDGVCPSELAVSDHEIMASSAGHETTKGRQGAINAKRYREKKKLRDAAAGVTRQRGRARKCNCNDRACSVCRCRISKALKRGVGMGLPRELRRSCRGCVEYSPACHNCAQLRMKHDTMIRREHVVKFLGRMCMNMPHIS